MLAVTPEQARTLAAIVETGTFDAAARQLHVTPSAVSQRMRALETTVGRPVLRRVRPVSLTEAGASVVRYARQLELLSTELAGELEPGAADPGPRIAVVENSDSLHTFALAGLAEVADRVRLEIVREDEEHSLELLRSGVVAAAITTIGAPVAGCSARRLGVLSYRAVCTPDFAERWFAAGIGPATLASAPVLCFDRKDDLQDRFLRRHRRRGLTPRRHFVPSTHEFAQAVRLGLGWALLPEQQLGDDLASGARVALQPAGPVDVVLHWQQWKLASAALEAVAAAVQSAARRVLR